MPLLQHRTICAHGLPSSTLLSLTLFLYFADRQLLLRRRHLLRSVHPPALFGYTLIIGERTLTDRVDDDLTVSRSILCIGEQPGHLAGGGKCVLDQAQVVQRIQRLEVLPTCLLQSGVPGYTFRLDPDNDVSVGGSILADISEHLYKDLDCSSLLQSSLLC